MSRDGRCCRWCRAYGSWRWTRVSTCEVEPTERPRARAEARAGAGRAQAAYPARPAIAARRLRAGCGLASLGDGAGAQSMPRPCPASLRACARACVLCRHRWSRVLAALPVGANVLLPRRASAMPWGGHRSGESLGGSEMLVGESGDGAIQRRRPRSPDGRWAAGRQGCGGAAP